MRMKIKIIIVANFDVFKELGEAVKLPLVNIGHDVDIVDDNNIGNFGDMNIVIKAFRPFNHGRMSGRKILLQTEELWNRRERGIYDLSEGWDRVLEMYPENVRIPRGTGNVVFCPITYSKAYEFNFNEDFEEEFDVLFYGSLTPRRKDILSELQKDIKFYISDKCFGDERNKIIMKSKIITNVKAHDRWSYGPLHLLFAQANKKFVLCEKTDGGHEPLIPGKHFIEWRNVNDFKDKVKYYLKNEKERIEFAENVYNDLKANYDYGKYLLEGLKGFI